MRVNQPNKNLHRYRKYVEKCSLPYGLIRYLTINKCIESCIIRMDDEQQGLLQLNELEKLPLFKQFL